MREWLEWRGVDFVEYDVERRAGGRARTDGGCSAAAARSCPMLVEDGTVVQIGWQGRGCIVDVEA